MPAEKQGVAAGAGTRGCRSRRCRRGQRRVWYCCCLSLARGVPTGAGRSGEVGYVLRVRGCSERSEPAGMLGRRAGRCRLSGRPSSGRRHLAELQPSAVLVVADPQGRPSSPAAARLSGHKP